MDVFGKWASAQEIVLRKVGAQIISLIGSTA